MKITVSRKSRRIGKCGSRTKCAIAVEMRKHGFTYVNVNQHHMRYRFNGVQYCIDTPWHVARFMSAFDNRERVPALTFEVPTNKAVVVTPKLTPLTLTRIEPNAGVAYAVPVDIFEKELA